MDLNATTELEAINTMLSCINEAPVTTLEDHGLIDVSKAQAVLQEISRKVQAKGWHFNSEDDYPLPRDGGGRIPLAVNMLRVDTSRDYAAYDVVQRGLKLYRRDEHTDIFDQDLKGEVVFMLPWEELPQAARDYIAIRAARVFQARTLGSDTKHKFSQEEEGAAHLELQEYDEANADHNMFNGSWSVANIINR
jgi:hypothetical protein